MDDLIERLQAGCVYRPKRWSGDTHDDLGGPIDEAATESLLAEAAEALEAARADAERIKRDIFELCDVMPMLPITAETMDAATDWFKRYCIDFHREIYAAREARNG